MKNDIVDLLLFMVIVIAACIFTLFYNDRVDQADHERIEQRLTALENNQSAVLFAAKRGPL